MREISNNTIIKKQIAIRGFGVIRKAETFGEIARKSTPFFRATPKSVFGDLSNCCFKGDLNLAGLNLGSLKGCPKEIVSGGLSLLYNRGLRDFQDFPLIKNTGKTLEIEFQHIFNMRNVPVYKYEKIENIYISAQVSEVSDRKKASIDISTAFLEFRRSRGYYAEITVSFFNSPQWSGAIETMEFNLDYEHAETIYSLYKKVGFDRKKFDRAIELI